jgi:hypothetical protein
MIQEPIASLTLHLVSSIDCSTFWVLFWESGPAKLPTTYSQYNLRDSVGTFQISADLDQARALLQKDKFFFIAPPDGFVTDAAWSVLSVKRCAVVTTIKVYDTVAALQDPAAQGLLRDLRMLVARANATRIAETPSRFSQSGLFDR